MARKPAGGVAAGSSLCNCGMLPSSVFHLPVARVRRGESLQKAGA